MKIWEAIDRLQCRKDFLQSECQDCWTEEMEMALSALLLLKDIITVSYDLERVKSDWFIREEDSI